MNISDSLTSEIHNNSFGDRRLSQRLETLARSLNNSPGLGLPKAVGSESGLEGAYRFFKNSKVKPDRILASHYESSCERARLEGEIIAIHDTTFFQFKGDECRPGMGIFRGANQSVYGFFGHFGLGVGINSNAQIGVLGVHTWTRDGKKGVGRRSKISQVDETSEYRRWVNLASIVESRLAERAQVIHVMDREADSYHNFTQLLDNKSRFVIRSGYERRTDKGILSEAVKSMEGTCEREVYLSKRGWKPARKSPADRKRHPTRNSRRATLTYSACSLTISRPPNSTSDKKFIKLNLVIAEELSPPPNTSPIFWALWTTEPINTESEVLRVIDIYRKRWQIEEFFKALKSGCAFEKKQLEGFHSLSNALAVYSLVAWRLMALRNLAKEERNLSARLALTERQINILRILCPKPIPENPTAKEALYGLAALGGHISNNGAPGWMVLGRGMDDILRIEQFLDAQEAYEM